MGGGDPSGFDVNDCSNGALYCAERGWVDPSQLLIDGGSAGGFTTLACLAATDTFAAGCSLYGVRPAPFSNLFGQLNFISVFRSPF